MWLWPKQSTILILVFLFCTLLLNYLALGFKREHDWGSDKSSDFEQIPTIIKGLSFYSTKKKEPVLSLRAQEMESLEQNYSYFIRPNGIYFNIDPEQVLSYQAESAEYYAKEQRLDLLRQAQLKKKDASYQADKISYSIAKKFIFAQGQVRLETVLKKSKDHLKITSNSMKSWNEEKKVQFIDQVQGQLLPFRRDQTPLYFWSDQLLGINDFQDLKLQENVRIHKDGVVLTARNGDFFLDRGNKKLKYFTLNDDVKMVEKMRLKTGEVVERRAFGERMEGFSQDESIHLTGAPRVEQGRDVIKGNKIILREKLEFIEIDDAMSDVETKKKKKGKP